MSSERIAPQYCYRCKSAYIAACSKTMFRCQSCGRKMHGLRPISAERAASIAKVKAEAITTLESLVDHMRNQGCLDSFHLDGRENRLIWYTDSVSQPGEWGVLAEVGTALELVPITTAVYERLQQLRHPPEKPKVLRGKELDAKAEEIWRRKEIDTVEPRSYRSALA